MPADVVLRELKKTGELPAKLDRERLRRATDYLQAVIDLLEQQVQASRPIVDLLEEQFEATAVHDLSEEFFA